MISATKLQAQLTCFWKEVRLGIPTTCEFDLRGGGGVDPPRPFPFC